MSIMGIKNKIANVSMVNVYAQTEEALEEIKNEFYEELNDKIDRPVIIIVLGDFIQKTGKKRI